MRWTLLAALLLPLAACSGERAGAQGAPAEAALIGQEAPRAPRARRPEPERPPEEPPLRVYDARVVRALPHDTDAFTQGLFFAEGQLYESTGKRGASVIRRVDLADGTALAEARLPDAVFGEGATVVDDRVVSLSWQSGIGFVHDLDTLAPLGTFEVAGEGWGLAYDEDRDRLVLSDGTPALRFLDPDTYEPAGSLTVALQGRPLPRLNELEVVPGEDGEAEVWANVWQQDFVVRIDPETGAVTGVVDVSSLHPEARRADPRDDVPNGIAYDEASGRLFMTGKRWPSLFEVELEERRR